MATTETLRPEVSATPGAASLSPAAFLSGRDEDRVVDLLAFALAAEAGDPPGPATVTRRREEAIRTMTDHAFRLLHNRVEEIRRDALAERLAALRPPPGLLTLVLANLVALGVVGALLAWLGGFGLEDLARLRPGSL